MAGLAASAFLLWTPLHVSENTHGVVRPWSYTGPVSLVEQQFRASHDALHRIDVWAYVDGAPGKGEIFARLTPVGSDAPVRESRAVVDARRFSDAAAAFHFEPIPDSGGKLYTLAIGVLSGPEPYVFLGLSDGAAIPEGAAAVSGAPTLYADDLAMRTFGSGRFVDVLRAQGPKRLALASQVILFTFLVVFSLVATWRGPSGPQPRFWRTFVGRQLEPAPSSPLASSSPPWWSPQCFQPRGSHRRPMRASLGLAMAYGDGTRYFDIRLEPWSRSISRAAQDADAWSGYERWLR